MAETFGQTLNRLAGAQKGRARGAPAYSVYVNRRLGRLLAAAAFRVGISPNKATLISAVFTFTGIVFLATLPAAPWLGVVVWLLLALGYVWDSVDGQLARLRGGGSLAGEWLDHFFDALKVSCLHLAVMIGVFRYFELSRPTWLLVPIGFSVVGSVTFFAMILNDLLKGVRGIPTTAVRGGSSPIRSILLIPTDYGFLCLVFVLWGWSTPFMVAYSAVAAICAVFLLFAVLKWFLEMKSIDAGSAH